MDCSTQGHFIASCAQSGYHPKGDVREIGMLPEFFTGMHIGQVQLDERDFDAT